MRTIITAAAASAAAAFAAIAPVAASAEADMQKFSRDGDTYVYTTKIRDDGATVISGRRMGGGTFRLVVANGRVRGTASGHAVAFRVAETAQQTGTILATN